MQSNTKALLYSTLLLALSRAVVATPDNAAPIRYVKASSMGISKRNSFTLDIQPQYIAMPLSTNPLVKRQSTCVAPAKACYEGCCKLGTVCGIYGGEKGCCPIGKNCSGVSGCQNSDDVPCTDYCCPSGTSCAKDSTGAGTCSSGTTNDTGNTDNSQCDAGYSACTQFDGCCPTGTQCVLPKNCDIPCASDDPICGTGCCKKGTHCTSKGTCAKDDDIFTTLVQTTRIITTQTTELPTEEPTEKLTTDLPTETPTDYPSTETTDTSSSPTDILPNNSDSTSTSTTSRVPTTTATRRTIATVNAAPTMGAMLGGGLGMAAGVLGVLAM